MRYETLCIMRGLCAGFMFGIMFQRARVKPRIRNIVWYVVMAAWIFTLHKTGWLDVNPKPTTTQEK